MFSGLPMLAMGYVFAFLPRENPGSNSLSPEQGALLVMVGGIFVLHPIFYIVFFKWIRRYKAESRKRELARFAEEEKLRITEEHIYDHTVFKQILRDTLRCPKCQWKIVKEICLAIDAKNYELFDIINNSTPFLLLRDSVQIDGTTIEPCIHCDYY